jgi:hypothetical protein
MYLGHSSFYRLNVARAPFGGKLNGREANDDLGRVVGVSEPEEWREISALQAVTRSSMPPRDPHVLFSSCRSGLVHVSR